MSDKTFRVHCPVSIEKSGDGTWRVKGLASTETLDKQGEIVVQKGLDITPLQQGEGWLNYDHHNDPKNLVGKIDNAYFGKAGLEIEGYLFQNHDQAKAIHQVMSSLPDKDTKGFSLSIEGKVLGKSENKIKRARIDRVAITSRPVNPDTFVGLAKALSDEEVFVEAFTEEIAKAMELGASYEVPPAQLQGAAALTTESMVGRGMKKPSQKKIKRPEIGTPHLEALWSQATATKLTKPKI